MAGATAITLLAAPAAAQRRDVDVERPGRSESSAAQPAAPKAVSRPPAPGSPRVWPIVVGSVLLVPSYGGAVYLAVSGSATSSPRVLPGTTFGSPIWLYLPVLGPLLFDDSYCHDAETYYASHPNGDDLYSACHRLFWKLDAAVQAIGAAFVIAGFAFPNPAIQASTANVHFVPYATRADAGIAAIGQF
jgi:hypothetical protein